MSEDYLKYRNGYSIGVGGVVIHENKVLLVRRASEPRKGDWALPGGYIEHDETIHVAVQREVHEETGVHAEVEGLIGIMNYPREGENGVYLMFLMRADNHTTQPDMVEVDSARYFALDELDTLETLQWLSRSVVTPILEGNINPIPVYPFPNGTPLDKGVLYAGHPPTENTI